MTGRRSVGDDSGFGLLEIMVVLMITAAMGTILVAMAGQFRPLNDKEEQISEISELHAVVRHVVKSLEAAEMLPLANDEGEPTGGYLEAKDGGIRFSAVMRTGVRQAVLSEAWIGPVQKGETSALVERLKRRGAGPDAPVQEIVLLPEIAGFSVGSPAGAKSAMPAKIEVAIERRHEGETIAVRGVAVPLAR